MGLFKTAEIVYVSGPQGCGKGSLIEGIRQREFDLGLMRFQIDDFKVSRHVQQQLGYASLSEACSSVERMVEFQDLIIQTKKESIRVTRSTCGADILITERSFIDMAAYFELWCSKLLQAGDITRDQFIELTVPYFERCYDAQRELGGTLVIIPMMDHVIFEHDINRASQEDIDTMFNLFMKHVGLSGVSAFFVTKRTVEDRANEVVNFLYGGPHGKI